MELTHIDASGQAHMVNVGAKDPMTRTARAAGKIRLAPDTLRLVEQGLLKKGDALAVARVAGILAAKKTADLIPLCHPLGLDHVNVDLRLVADGIEIESQAQCRGRTGVEMEALTAVAVAALTLYDMCKAVDKAMVIEAVRLVEKTKTAIEPDA